MARTKRAFWGARGTQNVTPRGEREREEQAEREERRARVGGFDRRVQGKARRAGGLVGVGRAQRGPS